MKRSIQNKVPTIIKPSSVINEQQEEPSEFWREVCFTKSIHPRSYHSSIVYQDYIYVYGGYDVQLGILQDFYKLNITSIQSFNWQAINSKPTLGYPGPRRNHSCILKDDQMIIVGGQVTTSLSTQNMNSFNFKTQKWAIVEQSAQLPTCIDGQLTFNYLGKIILFGGYFGSDVGKYNNRLWQFDFDTQSWSSLQMQGNQSPFGRAFAGGCILKDQLYIFGGTNSVVKFDDFWLFDFMSSKWTQIKSDLNFPQSRHGLTLNCYDDYILLFGGIRDVTREHNDLFIYDTKNTNWYTLQKDGMYTYVRKKISSNNQLPQITQTTSVTPKSKAFRKVAQLGNSKHNSSFNRSVGQASPRLQRVKRSKQVSPLMARIQQKFEQQQLYQFFFALNLSLAHQQKKKQQQIKKTAFLNELDLKNEKEIENLRQTTPLTAQLRNSLNLIGSQPKTHFLQSQTAVIKDTLGNYYTREFKFPKDQRVVNVLAGKVPCARDGHTSNIVIVEDQIYLLVFGGDRHLLSFNDLHLFDIQSAILKIK